MSDTTAAVCVEKIGPISKDIVQWRTLLRAGATVDVEVQLVSCLETLLVDFDLGAVVHDMENIIKTLRAVPAVHGTELPITAEWCEEMSKTLLQKTQASSSASLTAGMNAALQCWRNKEAITKENWGELTAILQKCMASKGIATEALTAARACLAAFAKEVSVLLLNPTVDGEETVGTETMLTSACQCLLAACEAFDGDDKILVKEVHAIAALFWELGRAMPSADDESLQKFFKDDIPGGKSTALFLQRVLEAKKAQAHHHKVDLCLGLVEKGLQELLRL